VVVTGVGLVTAYGAGWEANAEGFRSGRPAFSPVTLFDVSRQRVKTAAQVCLPAALPEWRLSQRRQQRLERAAKILLLAGGEALAQAGWPLSERAGVPIVLGTTSGGMSRGEEFYREARRTSGGSKRDRSQPSRVTYYLAQRQAIELAEAFGLAGSVTMIANACAAGANAVGHAWEQIRSGQCERVLAGGYDALSQLVFAGFDSLQALSPTVCRPFDQNRDGLALGEGAAVLTLESLQSAEARGAAILGEIAGYGAATDSHHLTQPHPEGQTALTTMRLACAAAKVQPHQIAYVNAHGTGTQLNDSAETAAINVWAGKFADEVFVSSTKAGIGHLLGAAGAVEAALCVISLREQWLPPMLSTMTPDRAIRFRLVQRPVKAKELGKPFEYALSNSFGFGGANATLIFRRWP
jgi:3-oxoacyl-[acyl-carrier-protein] synthase II